MSAWWVPVLLGLAGLPWAGARQVRPGTGAQDRSLRRRRWGRRATGPGGDGPREGDLDTAVLADILGAAIASGASIPAALGAVGRAVPGEHGAQFVRVAATLRLGGDWHSAWAQAEERYQALARALQPAWEDGVAPGALLTQAAARIRRRRTEASREAASRLGVHLVLPMGLCWLPAFVLLGLAPVVLSTGGSLWP